MATPDRAITASVMKNVSMTYAPCDFFTGRPIRPSSSVVFHRATTVQNCSQMKINTGPFRAYGHSQTTSGTVWTTTDGNGQSGSMAVEYACLGDILFLLRRHCREIPTARHTARPELSANALVLGWSFFLDDRRLHLMLPSGTVRRTVLASV